MRVAVWIMGACLAPVLCAIPNPAAAGEADLRSSVVRIETVYQRPSYVDPWKMNSQRNGSGSGCIIAGRRILTNAHVVSDAKYIQVQKHGDINRYPAEIEFIAHDCDLALLKVKEEAFFSATTPVTMGGLPRVGDQVGVYGFPEGGDKLSLTRGVVSRIEITQYSHSLDEMLSVQIDAAINPGNSGGPVISAGRLVGIAFEVMQESENIGYIIPVPVIERFFRDIADRRYDGVPHLGCEVQPLLSDAMRAALKVGDGLSGVFVTAVNYESSLWQAMREGDVLIGIDGVTIAKDGTVPFGSDDRIGWAYLMTGHQIGDEVKVTFIRDGARLECPVKLKGYNELVPLLIYERQPTYFIDSGLVFMPETLNYLFANFERDKIPANLRIHVEKGRCTAARQQVVILTKVLAHDINRGYHEFEDEIVSRVNGTPVARIEDLVRAFGKPLGGYHEIWLESGMRIILDARASGRAGSEILARYGIPDERSADLRGI